MEVMSLVIFDLDGTLVDSVQDLANAVNATRESRGLARLPDEQVASYVGNGAPVLIQRAMGPEATAAELEDALAYFLGYYREHMLEHTRAYAGVAEALETLHARGHHLAILTNKPVRFSKEMIEGLGLSRFFFRIYGGNSFEQKKPHPIGIETLMAESGIGPEKTVMVGDSATDVRTARNAGVRAIGVTYGISPESLGEAPPDVLLDSMAELPAHIG